MKTAQNRLERLKVVFDPAFTVPRRSGTAERLGCINGKSATLSSRSVGTGHWYGWGALAHPNQPFRSTSLTIGKAAGRNAATTTAQRTLAGTESGEGPWCHSDPRRQSRYSRPARHHGQAGPRDGAGGVRTTVSVRSPGAHWLPGNTGLAGINRPELRTSETGLSLASQSARLPSLHQTYRMGPARHRRGLAVPPETMQDQSWWRLFCLSIFRHFILPFQFPFPFRPQRARQRVPVNWAAALRAAERICWPATAPIPRSIPLAVNTSGPVQASEVTRDGEPLRSPSEIFSNPSHHQHPFAVWPVPAWLCADRGCTVGAMA
jgi:hypothetical protein